MIPAMQIMLHCCEKRTLTLPTPWSLIHKTCLLVHFFPRWEKPTNPSHLYEQEQQIMTITVEQGSINVDSDDDVDHKMDWDSADRKRLRIATDH